MCTLGGEEEKKRSGASLRSNSAVSIVGGSKKKVVPFAMSGPVAEKGVLSAILIVWSFDDSLWALNEGRSPA